MGHIHAHGLSTRSCDAEEAAAIGQLLDGAVAEVPIVAAKSHFGNLGAGGGAAELVASILALDAGHLFPVLNFQHPDPESRLAVTTSRQVPGGSKRAESQRNSSGPGQLGPGSAAELKLACRVAFRRQRLRELRRANPLLGGFAILDSRWPKPVSSLDCGYRFKYCRLNDFRVPRVLAVAGRAGGAPAVCPAVLFSARTWVGLGATPGVGVPGSGELSVGTRGTLKLPRSLFDTPRVTAIARLLGISALLIHRRRSSSGGEASTSDAGGEHWFGSRLCFWADCLG